MINIITDDNDVSSSDFIPNQGWILALYVNFFPCFFFYAFSFSDSVSKHQNEKLFNLAPLHLKTIRKLILLKET